MSDKLIFNCTHGKEDPERATLPFVAANIAATAGQESIVLCTIEAVWVGTEGGTDGIAQPGLPGLAELYREFIDNGGQVWLGGASTVAPGPSARCCPRRSRWADGFRRRTRSAGLGVESPPGTAAGRGRGR